jgi:hypothetical protein
MHSQGNFMACPMDYKYNTIDLIDLQQDDVCSHPSVHPLPIPLSILLLNKERKKGDILYML